MIKYRKAAQQDANQLAILFDIASAGMIEFLLHDLVENKSPVDLMAMTIATDNAAPSYKNCYVACDGDNVIGMINYYSAAIEQFTEEDKKIIPAKRIDYIKNLLAAKIPGSLYLDSLAILPKYRRHKIGQALVTKVKHTAVEQDYKSICLFAWADNVSTIKFYQREGFTIVRSVPTKNHPLLNHKNGGYLMVLDDSSNLWNCAPSK